MPYPPGCSIPIDGVMSRSAKPALMFEVKGALPEAQPSHVHASATGEHGADVTAVAAVKEA